MKYVDDLDVKGFLVRGFRCECGNAHSEPEDVDKIVKFFIYMKKQKGLKVFKSGNSLALRIPKQIAEVYHLTPSSKLVLSPEKDQLVIKIINP
jgi:hypothetical protein